MGHENLKITAYFTFLMAHTCTPRAHPLRAERSTAAFGAVLKPKYYPQATGTSLVKWLETEQQKYQYGRVDYASWHHDPNAGTQGPLETLTELQFFNIHVSFTINSIKWWLSHEISAHNAPPNVEYDAQTPFPFILSLSSVTFLGICPSCKLRYDWLLISYWPLESIRRNVLWTNSTAEILL